jgi:cyclic pyranopterin phosphate synthase
MIDRYGRKIEYMRVSITDRCNLRCKYCMPEGCDKVSMSKILTYEEIERICRAAADLGISKIKITGGEPFVRLGCTDLMRKIKAIEGIEEVTVTTNGQNLNQFIDELKEIGIDGINISLDTLDPEKFSYITGMGSLDKTIEAIELAASSGIKTKVNCVLQKGFNDDEIYSLAELAFKYKIDVRFIELMPIGIADPETGVSNQLVLQQLKDRWPDLEPDSIIHGNGPAVYYKRPDVDGGIGLISAIHGKFCSDCNRVRLTSQGQLKTCLYYGDMTDLKPYLKKTESDLKVAIYDAIMQKPEAHCFSSDNNSNISMDKSLMSQIGG